jgi:hypothetical protein
MKTVERVEVVKVTDTSLFTRTNLLARREYESRALQRGRCVFSLRIRTVANINMANKKYYVNILLSSHHSHKGISANILHKQHNTIQSISHHTNLALHWMHH